MRVRLGYVAIALNLSDASTSQNMTYKHYRRLSPEKRLNKLKLIAMSNLKNLTRILEYNAGHNIHFYRITSRLFPLATHPDVTDWDYRRYFRVELAERGEIIKKHSMRVDTHPDHYFVLNSEQDEVVEQTRKTLWQHVHLFEDMEYPEGRMVMHIGSGQGGKEAATRRFVERFNELPEAICSRLILENDDTVFTAADVLAICQEVGAPMVLDVHHHRCLGAEEYSLEPMIEDIFATWNGQPLPPKVHLSSPQAGGRDKNHADYIDPADFIDFVTMCSTLDRDFDVMLEAKKKDQALFRLVEDIKKEKPEWEWEDESTLRLQ